MKVNTRGDYTSETEYVNAVFMYRAVRLAAHVLYPYLGVCADHGAYVVVRIRAPA